MSVNNKLLKALEQGNYEDELSKFKYICLTGGYFGYPSCCILHYYHYFSFETNELDCELKCINIGNDTGFVPCPCHADDILSNKCELGDLINYKLRESYYDFPDDPNNDTLYVHYVDKYKKFIKKLHKLYMNTEFL